MRYLFMISMTAVLALLLESCALSPQTITLKPEMNVSVMSYGGGRIMNVRVEDKRASAIIGKRGGVYGDSSIIEIGNDFKTEIAYALVSGLSRWGFKSQVNGNDTDAMQFTLALTELSYVPEGNQAIGKVHIKSAFSLDLKQGGHSYRANYESSGEMGYVTVPSEAKNNAQINQVLNLGLQKIFEDQALIKFLQD